MPDLKEILDLSKDDHFLIGLLIVAICAVVTALISVWLDSRQKTTRIKEKDKQIVDCYEKHLTSAGHIEEMKALLIARKTRTRTRTRKKP